MKTIDTKALRMKILDLAMSGKLVPQDPNDESVEVLLERIKVERESLVKQKKIKKVPDYIIYKGDDNRYYEKIDGNATEIKAFRTIPNSWIYIHQYNICWLENGEVINDKLLPYLEAKVIRGTKQPINVNNGVIVYPGQKVILVDGENSGEVMSIPYEGYMGSTFKILAFSSCINQKFLAYFFEINREKYRNNKKGSAIPHLNKELFKYMPFPLPPLAEQERIVEKLDTLLSFITLIEEKSNSLIEIKENLKQKTLTLAIQGKLVPQDSNDEPASELLKRIRAEKKAQLGKKYVESYIFKGDDNYYYEHINGKNIDITEEIPFDLPKSWEWTKLKDIVTNLTDGTHRTPRYTIDGVPFISVKDVSSGTLSFSNTKYISFEEHNELIKRCNPEKGDILLTKVGTTGIPVLVDTDKRFSLFVSVALIKYNCKFVITQFFIYLLKSPLVQQQAADNTRGVGNKNWVLTDIENTLLAIPPLTEQKRIVDKIDEIFAKL